MRTKKQIDKEIQELQELDRITTIKVNQQFADRKQQEKQKDILNNLFNSFNEAQKNYINTIK